MTDTKTRDTSYEGIDVSDKDYGNTHPTNVHEAIESMSTTRRLAKSAHENRVLITMWVAILGWIALEFVFTRDASIQQPHIDKMQDYQLEEIKSDIQETRTDVQEIKRGQIRLSSKVDALLDRLDEQEF